MNQKHINRGLYKHYTALKKIQKKAYTGTEIYNTPVEAIAQGS